MLTAIRKGDADAWPKAASLLPSQGRGPPVGDQTGHRQKWKGRKNGQYGPQPAGEYTTAYSAHASGYDLPKEKGGKCWNQ